MAAILKVIIHSEINEFPTEKRFDPNIKVGELKKKLELITGANHSSMKVTAFNGDEQIGELDNNDKSVADYIDQKPGEQLTLKLVVKDDQVKEILCGDVPKYEIDEEKYLERENNARKFINEVREKLNSEKINK